MRVSKTPNSNKDIWYVRLPLIHRDFFAFFMRNCYFLIRFVPLFRYIEQFHLRVSQFYDSISRAIIYIENSLRYSPARLRY